MMNSPRTINMARTLANIQSRANKIADDYRLIWSREQGAWFVAHTTDRSRRYRVTAETCACPSFTHLSTCKHFLGLGELSEVEIGRYRLLGFARKMARVEAFAEELAQAAQWRDPEHVERMAERYAR